MSKENFPQDYEEQLKLAKLDNIREDTKRLALANEKARVELDKQKANLCYITVAVDEFYSAIANVCQLLKVAPASLAQRIKLTSEQSEGVQEYFEELLTMLAEIEITLSTTEDVDAKCSHANAAERRKKRGC